MESAAAHVKQEVMDNQISGGASMGLSMLMKVDGFHVDQQWEALETLTCGCYNGQNRYKVMDKSGKVQLFFVKERSGFCWRYCCAQHRPFRMNVNDVTGAKDQKMAVFHRPFHCLQWAICPCCLPEVYAHYTVDEGGKTINTSSETLVGTMKTPWCGGCCVPTYDIFDRNDVFHARVTGPCCFVCDFCGADFNIHNASGNHIGTLKKLGAKTMRDVVMELNTDADQFKMEFPHDLAPEIKLTLLATIFHIDFSFCACCCYATKEDREKAEKKKHNRGGPQGTEMSR